MTCERYRPLLALLVGNDLDPREASDVRQHLGDCAACQSVWASFQTSIGALQTVSQKPVAMEGGSLKTAVLQRLESRAELARESAPGWMTLGAFSAACAAVLWLTVSTPVFEFDLSDPHVATLEETSPSMTRVTRDQYPQLNLVGASQPAVPVGLSSRSQVMDRVPGDQPMSVPSGVRWASGPRSF